MGFNPIYGDIGDGLWWFMMVYEGLWHWVYKISTMTPVEHDECRWSHSQECREFLALLQKNGYRIQSLGDVKDCKTYEPRISGVSLAQPESAMWKKWGCTSGFVETIHQFGQKPDWWCSSLLIQLALLPGHSLFDDQDHGFLDNFP